MKKSYFIIPLSFLFHIVAINLILYLFTPETYRNGYSILYYNLTWLIVTYCIDFYPIARRDGFRKNMPNFFLLFLLYGLVYFSSFYFCRAPLLLCALLNFCISFYLYYAAVVLAGVLLGTENYTGLLVVRICAWRLLAGIKIC